MSSGNRVNAYACAILLVSIPHTAGVSLCYLDFLIGVHDTIPLIMTYSLAVVAVTAALLFKLYSLHYRSECSTLNRSFTTPDALMLWIAGLNTGLLRNHPGIVGVIPESMANVLEGVSLVYLLSASCLYLWSVFRSQSQMSPTTEKM